MNKFKIVLYILVVIGMLTIPFFIKDLGMIDILLAYTLSVAVGYVI